MSSRRGGTRHDKKMKISLGSDHAGFRYKEKVKELLVSLGHEVKDCGTFNEEPVDYPVFIPPAAVRRPISSAIKSASSRSVTPVK